MRKTRKSNLWKPSDAPKDGKTLIAIDPASKQVGVALFSEEGKLLNFWQLSSNEATWGKRLSELSSQFSCLPFEFDQVQEIAIESLKGAANSPMLNSISGIFIQHLPNAKLNSKSFITAPKWKGFIRKTTGEKSPLPKGTKSLKLYDSRYPEMPEDCADAVMIGLTYIADKGNISVRKTV